MASNEQNVAGLVLTDAADPKLAKIYSKVRRASDPYTFPHFVASCSISKYNILQSINTACSRKHACNFLHVRI